MDHLLSSFDSPVGLVKGFCNDTARTVKMGKSRRSLYGGNFDLTDEDDKLLLNVDTSIRKGKTFSDAEGKEILHSGTTMWTRETKVTNPEGTEVAWASSKGAFSYGLAMEFIDISTGQKRLLGVKGDWKRNATLVVDDEVVAAVEKHSVLKSGRTIRIVANIDLVLVFVAAVLFDQAANDTDANTAAIAS